jgi:LacI family transcriptional regulator
MTRPIEDFCCQNDNCSHRGKRGAGNLSFKGWSGKGKKIRLIHCKECKTNFSERKGTVLSQSRLKEDKVVQILDHLREGCGTRSTGRLAKVSARAVTRYIKVSGKVAEAFHNENVAFSP